MTNFQLILFQMYGIIKILIATSSIKIIGTISIVGNINASPEIEIAENPKPLKPLTVAATSIMIRIKIKFVKLNSKKLSKCIRKYTYH